MDTPVAAVAAAGGIGRYGAGNGLNSNTKYMGNRAGAGARGGGHQPVRGEGSARAGPLQTDGFGQQVDEGQGCLRGGFAHGD